MYTLNNGFLTISLLDPVADRVLTGTRYNTGGSLYQVTDQRLGDLLSGPTFPNSYNVYDGQGIPDAFHDRLPGGDADPCDLGIGIGRIDRAAKTVAEPCVWTVAESRGQISFATTHSFLGWRFDLVRTVILWERTVRSATRVVNRGAALPLNWFPHPFYPTYPTGECCRPSFSVTAPTDHVGYVVTPQGWVKQKDLPWADGHLLRLGCENAPSRWTMLQKHPRVGLAAAHFDYAPSQLPIWGNKNTFSFEPYLNATVAPGQSLDWTVDYDF